MFEAIPHGGLVFAVDIPPLTLLTLCHCFPKSRSASRGMPLFALAYGSFGDILATVQLAIKIAILLRQRDTPSTECKKTEAELKSLSGDLDLAHLALQRMPTSPLFPFVAKRLHDEVSRSHELMARFFTKITAPRGLWDKVWWAASQEKELAAFRAQVIERRTALGLIVDFMNSCVTCPTCGRALITICEGEHCSHCRTVFSLLTAA